MSVVLLHNPIEGLGSFYGGLLHPLVVPEQVLLLVTGAVAYAQGGLSLMRRAIPAQLLALTAAVFLQPTLDWTPPAAPLLGVALVLGLMVAARRPPAGPVGLAIGLVSGLGVGLGTEVDTIPWGEETLFQSGALLGAAFLTLCLADLCECARGPAASVMQRVVGSWAAAAALIVLSWTLVQA